MVAAFQVQVFNVEELLKLDLPNNREYELWDRIIVPMVESSGQHDKPAI